MRGRRRAILFSLALAALFYIALTAWSNVGTLVETFRHFSWRYLPFIFGLTLCNYGVRFGNWQFYLSSLGIRSVKRLDSLLIFLSGFALTISPGKIGEVVRSFLLKEAYAVPISQTGSLVLVDRLTDLMALVFIAAVGSLHFQYGSKVLIVLSLILLGALIIITSRPLAETLLTRVPSQHGQKLRALYESSYTLLQPKRLVIILLISILAWGCEATGFFLTFRALHLPADLFTAYFIYAFSTIIGAVSLLPGGLGLTEGSITGLLLLVHIGKEAAVAATLVIRAATLWFGVILGASCLLIVEKRFPKTS